MYAVIKTGGKQYRVEPGVNLHVERLQASAGDIVEFQPILVADKAVKVGKDLEGASVKAKVISHERGKKVRIFKFKPKRGYKKTLGHRQEITKIEITEIG